MTAPARPPTMGTRCLSALAALGGEATAAEVLARVEADWRRPLLPAQVTGALARLSQLDPPPVTRRPAPEGGFVWRTAEAEGWPDPVRPWAAGFPPFTAADVEATGAAAVAALREAPC